MRIKLPSRAWRIARCCVSRPSRTSAAQVNLQCKSAYRQSASRPHPRWSKSAPHTGVPEYEQEVFFVEAGTGTARAETWYRTRDHRGGWVVRSRARGPTPPVDTPRRNLPAITQARSRWNRAPATGDARAHEKPRIAKEHREHQNRSRRSDRHSDHQEHREQPRGTRRIAPRAPLGGWLSAIQRPLSTVHVLNADVRRSQPKPSGPRQCFLIVLSSILAAHPGTRAPDTKSPPNPTPRNHAQPFRVCTRQLARLLAMWNITDCSFGQLNSTFG